MGQNAWLAAALVAMGSVAGRAQPAPQPSQSKYVDLNQPGSTARVFAPGLVSRLRVEGAYAERPVFSPDFRECYFDVNNYKEKTFTSFSMRYQKGEWTQPAPAFFARYGGYQASVSADGKRLFFVAPSPHDTKVVGIWMAKREGEGWAEPAFLDAPINAGSDARFPCATASGALYYRCSTKDGEAVRSGVCRAQPVNGRYALVEKIGRLQSAAGLIMGDFYVAPDESYIVIYSTLPDNLGQGDLYVSFRHQDDTWTDLRNLGPAVNTKGYDFAPSISPDGRFLFFTRDRGDKQGDVYWISSEGINKLKRAGE
jgi:hypothetical protein